MQRNLFDKLLRRSHKGGTHQCASVQDKLFAYLDGELSPTMRLEVETHLAECRACSIEAAQRRASEHALIGAAAALPTPGDLRPAFYARLEADRRRAQTNPWIWAAPAMAVAGTALFFIMPHREKPTITTRGADSTIVHNPPIRHESADAVWTDTAAAASHRSKMHHGLARSSISNHKNPAVVAMRTDRNYELMDIGTSRSRQIAAPRSTLGLSSLAVSGIATASGRDDGIMLKRSLSSMADWAPRADGNSILSAVPAAAYTVMPREAHVSMASLVTETEVHVSDEDRDFMSCTQVDAKAEHKDRSLTLRVDGEADTAEVPVELPALP